MDMNVDVDILSHGRGRSCASDCGFGYHKKFACRQNKGASNGLRTPLETSQKGASNVVVCVFSFLLLSADLFLAVLQIMHLYKTIGVNADFRANSIRSFDFFAPCLVFWQIVFLYN